MKKQLLCTSAIALGVAAAPASAQDWNLDWGGFFQQHVAFTDVGGNGFGPAVDFDGVQMFTNAEIIFTPNITLDNGLTFGVNVQMEAANGGGGIDGIDESYMSISGDTFGRIEAGFENSAGYKMMVAAPQVGSMAINSPSASAFIPFTPAHVGAFRTAGLSSYTEVAGNNDVARISYYTPSFNGFTAGISYAPSAAGNAANVAPVDRDAAGSVTDIFDIGVNYSQSFGTTDVTLAARWGTGDRQGAGDPETWAVGFQVGFSGFTFGAAYAENDGGFAGGGGDSEGYSVGVAYDMAGPWTFGLEAYLGEADDGAGFNDDYEYYKLAANRDLGPGVSWTTYLLVGETTNDSIATKVDGTAVGTAINLSF